MRKFIIYITSFLLLLITFPSNSMASGDDVFKKNKNTTSKKGNFHKDKKFGTRGGSKGLIPPDPGGGGGGDPIPIGNGLSILLVLSGIYLTRKIKKEIKK